MLANTKYLSIFYLIFFASSSVDSQSPYNLKKNLKLWVKSDSGVILSSVNQVSQWRNQVANPTITVEATKPANFHVVYNENVFNYNPSLYFDGATSEELVGQADPNNWIDSLTVYTFFNFQGISPVGPYKFPGVWDSNYKGLLGFDTYWGVDGYEAYDIYTANTPVNSMKGTQIVALEYTQNSTYNSTIYKDGKLSENFKGSSKPSVPGSLFEIGGRTKYDGLNDRIFVGNLAEILVFRGGHTFFEKQKIHSYLALKYGFTLDRSGINAYLNTMGNTVYADASGTYWHDIIGISRDDNSTLLQKQSHQVNDSTRIYISALTAANNSNTGSFSSDNQFIVIGNNADLINANILSNEYPTGKFINKRIRREWKVLNTNFSGSFSMDINSTIGNGVNVSDLRLLVDDDGDFSNASVFSAGFSYANGVVTINNISNTIIPINSTKYVTIASVCSIADPTFLVTQPTCSSPNGKITITSPLGTIFSYSIDGSNYSNTNGIFSNLTPNNYIVSIKGSNGCFSNGMNAIVNPIPTFQVNPIVSIVQPTCITPLATLTITSPLGSGLVYSIDGNNYSNISGLFNGISSGNYTVTVKNSQGCISNGQLVTVNNLKKPDSPRISVIYPTCDYLFGTIKVVFPLANGYSYSINDIDYNNMDGIFSGLLAGNYFISIKNSEGCISTKTAVTLKVLQPLKINLTTSPTTIGYGGHIVNFNVSGNIPFIVKEWLPKSTFQNQTSNNQSVFLNSSGVFSVKCSTVGGCNDSASVSVSQKLGNYVFVPTAFSPNGNGLNDYLKVYGNSIKNLSFKIFNRWGEIVFQTSDIAKGWDGNYKGLPQSTSVFVYSLKVTFIDGIIESKKGTITLLR